MNRKSRGSSYSLHTQLIIGFGLLAVLTAALAGLPAVMLLNQELEKHAWIQAGAGRDASIEILNTLQEESKQVSILVAQRPTLEELVRAGDTQQLNRYIRTLQTGSSVSLVMVCDRDARQLASSSEKTVPNLCKRVSGDGFYLDQKESQFAVWIIHRQPFPKEESNLGWVLIGKLIDQTALEQLAQQTGLEQVLVYQGQVLTASLPEPVSFVPLKAQNLPSTPEARTSTAGSSHAVMRSGGNPFFSIRSPYGFADLELITALPVTELYQKQALFQRYFSFSILLAAGVGSFVGYYAAKGISRPLRLIGQSAERLRKGNLDIPIPLDIPVREVNQIARSLEESRKALQHSLNELNLQRLRTEHLMESIVEGIITLDHLGRVTFFSQGAERITGLRQEDVLGQRCNDIFHPVAENTQFSDFIPAPDQRRKVELALTSGRVVTLSISGAKLTWRQNSHDVAALVLRDVSDEESLRFLLGEFLGNITHEFRTPLSALAASIELLQEQLPDLRPEEINELLGSIQLGIIGLQTLIDNLLEGASIETGQFQVFPKPAQAAEIISETVNLLQPLMAKYHQNLHVEIPGDSIHIRADVRRSVQVLVNLLSNAIKNNPENGKIGIFVSEEEPFACFRVVDEGPGVPVDQLSSIFTRFVRFEPVEQRSQAGAGLGLSVVKAIVEAQGGQVGAYNRPEGGAVFFFTIPLLKEET